MYLKEIGYEILSWIHLTMGKDQWRTLANAITELSSIKYAEFFDQLREYLLPGNITVIILLRAEFLYPLRVAVILLHYNTTIRIPNVAQDFPSRIFLAISQHV
jgi:hypothetical protein